MGVGLVIFVIGLICGIVWLKVDLPSLNEAFLTITMLISCLGLTFILGPAVCALRNYESKEETLQRYCELQEKISADDMNYEVMKKIVSMNENIYDAKRLSPSGLLEHMTLV